MCESTTVTGMPSGTLEALRASDVTHNHLYVPVPVVRCVSVSSALAVSCHFSLHSVRFIDLE